MLQDKVNELWKNGNTHFILMIYSSGILLHENKIFDQYGTKHFDVLVIATLLIWRFRFHLT
jgi:hypothetical protein